MSMSEMNRRAMRILAEWDPFKAGEEAYDAEIADVVEELHIQDHPSDLGRKIQHIYEFSFDQWIPLEKCVEISYKLLALKYEAKSII